MPSLTLSKKALLASIGRKLTDDELKDRISMLGTDLEGIDGDEINVEIFPNRPDLLSQQGFARAFASFLGIPGKTGLRNYPVRKTGKRCVVEKSVASCRPYTACAIVTGLRITEECLKEIILIQEKLHVTFCRNRKRAAIGIYPCEQIAFPIRFTGLKPDEIRFRPLEAAREMTATEILEEHPKGREYAHLLEGLERYACFVDAKGNVMSLTPIINSHLTGKITERTTKVFIECSGFDQRILDECLAMIVTALADMGGRIGSMELAYPGKKLISPVLAPGRMNADRRYINRLLGLALSEKELRQLLARMGFGHGKGDALIPAYRTDILHPADLAEEVAIAYGYEKVPETIPDVTTVGQESRAEILAAKLRELLVGHGLLECKGYNLINAEAQTTRMGLGGALRIMTLKNPVSLEYDSLRAWVLPSLLETLQRNRRHEYPQRIFEVGRVFAQAKTTRAGSEGGNTRGRKSDATETRVVEKVQLAVALCGEDADYTAIRQVLDDLCAKLGLTPMYAETTHASFLPGRVARVSLGNEGIAYVGELHPRVLENFGLAMPVAGFELDVSALRHHL